ncbi:MAG: hypothetical protein HWN67_15830, partial [Candidatus Helarchaeota archaeon]|nr:hypothetical protein [Candidatus Helarchaeota archaeon]
MSFKKNLDNNYKLSQKKGLSEVDIKDAMETLRKEIKDNVKMLTQLQADLKKYFHRNFKDHLSTKDYIDSYSEFIEKSDSILSYNISKISDIIQEDKHKKLLLKFKTFWAKNRKRCLDILHFYQSRINKRIEFEEFINERMSELQNFSDELDNQINNMIDEDKLTGAIQILNESTKKYSDIVLKHNIEFKNFKGEINRNFSDSIKFFVDLKSTWINKNNEEKRRWRNFVLESRKKLSTSKEIIWKDELDQKIGAYIDDLDNQINNMINEDKLTGAIQILNESTKKYSDIVLKHNIEFKNFKGEINR